MRLLLFTMLVLSLCLVDGCTPSPPTIRNNKPPVHHSQQHLPTKWNPSHKQALIDQYKKRAPHEWGEQVTGVKKRLQTQQKVIVLTLDACGGPNGSQYDKALIDYLLQQQIPATLFVNKRWIEANPTIFQALAKHPLFEIGNHGTHHLPLSVNGKSAYGIKGTQNVAEVIDEIWQNHQKIKQLTGKPPQFFRSGTAHYDEVAVQIANELGEQVVNFDINGDAGATYSKNEVKEALLRVKPGSIIILHMNQPKKETAEGIKEAIPKIKKLGYQFVHLTDYPLQ